MAPRGCCGAHLVLATRPQRSVWLSRQALLYGLITVAMNASFYEAIARIPLGTAVAIEFLGPIAVAAWGSRTVRDWGALLAAIVGVLVLSGAQWSVSPAGIGWILAAATMWGLYILISDKLASGAATFQAMGVGLLYASIILSPMVAWKWAPVATTQTAYLLCAALGLGLLSAVIPYCLDLVMLRMSSPGYYAVLLALLPVTAAFIGMVVLRQLLTPLEVGGVLLIVAAVALRKQTR